MQRGVKGCALCEVGRRLCAVQRRLKAARDAWAKPTRVHVHLIFVFRLPMALKALCVLIYTHNSKVARTKACYKNNLLSFFCPHFTYFSYLDLYGKLYCKQRGEDEV